MRALDGKAVCGVRTRDADGNVSSPHLVSVIDQASGAVLGQVQVDAKGSEVTAFTTVLDRLGLPEVLISAASLHTDRGHACYLHECGGHQGRGSRRTSPRCRGGYGRCPGPGSVSARVNEPVVTAAPRPAPTPEADFHGPGPTAPRTQCSSIALVALLEPGVCAVVVAASLPETR